MSALRIMDPACGSGLLLETAFHKLLELKGVGATVSYAEAMAALGQLHGMDISLFSCAVARCTLIRALLERLAAPEQLRLEELPLNIQVGNALLELAPGAPEGRSARFEVVLVEPPFITERNPELRELYRERYESAWRNFSLIAPFIELAFSLSVENGFIGALVGNSWVKRGYGRALVERVLPRQDLTCVVDASGAYIPGHGTPTMMIFARRRLPSSDTVRAVLGHRGEPITPSAPEEGRVWTEIREHIGDAGFEGEFVTVSELPRQDFARHPWALSAGRGREVMAYLERHAAARLGDIAQALSGPRVRFEFALAHSEAFFRHHVPTKFVRELIRGSELADWSLEADERAALPDFSREDEPLPPLLFRVLGGLANIPPSFGIQEEGELRGNVARLLSREQQVAASPAVLGFPQISRQNHFVRLPEDGFTTGTVVRLRLSEARRHDDEQTMALLAYLNSSTAWFWMQHFFYSKALGERTQARYRRDLDVSSMLFEFSPQPLMELPVPDAVISPGLPREQLAERARKLEQLAEQHRQCAPRFVLGEEVQPDSVDSRRSEHGWDRKSRSSLVKALARARHEEEILFREMVFHQEELDWLVYSAWRLARFESIPSGRAIPEHRPFSWTSDEPPEDLDRGLAYSWAERQRQRKADPRLETLDAKACKRWWFSRSEPRKGGDYDSRRTQEACKRWLLTQVERLFREQRSPAALTPGEIAEALSSEPDVRAVAEVLEGKAHPELAELLTPLIEDDAVPFLTSMRFSSSGLSKARAWEHLWSLQRHRPVSPHEARQLAPRYVLKDFQKTSWWRLRGQVDLPRERFISYPRLVRDGADVLYGWAGWTFLQQAEVLETLYRTGQREGWTSERLLLILQGVEELLPWIQQYHQDAAPRWNDFVETA
ncbi:DUF7008 domain-containing protein [Archangium sp.]|uniref:DUF7008 domain-containing protein n=1 Tax=Archangium sp. TaxID=1872627 RepID=UPI002D610765|nr:hypothetical protein [Archangium sp.]HYO54676.1 hypothetical protein [Archangium sp.]